MKVMDRQAAVPALDWLSIETELDAFGCGVAQGLISAEECDRLAGLCEDESRFRSRVIMARHNFGRGEYKYFAYPLPEFVAELRTALYPPLAAIANRWQERLESDRRFPSVHARFLDECRRAGQDRPTPLLLRYGPGDFNCLHQDLYGEQVFPIQATVLLSAPGRDFAGGEFVLTEQRPRAQSRVEAVSLAQGDAVFFAVNHRPVAGTRGFHRVAMRHGVSRIRRGQRLTMGLIFHDAR